MFVTSTVEPRTVVDYKITFTSGLQEMWTIDEGMGDTIEFLSTPLAITIHHVAKPTVTDPDVKTQPDEVTIYVSQIAYIEKRPRLVAPIPPEHTFDLRNSILTRMPKSVN